MRYNNRLLLSAHDKPAGCSGCALSQLGDGFVPPEGTGYSGVVAIGQMAGANEVENGTPLHPAGAAGAIFERTLRRLGVNRQSLLTLNVLSCAPPNNKLQGEWYEWQALEHCKQHWQRRVLDMPDSAPTYKRKVILAMGDIATKTLTGLGGKFDSLRGYPEVTPYGLVLPTYNPAKLIAGREAKLIGVFRKDFQLALRLAQQGWELPKVSYDTNPSVREGWEFYARCKSAVGSPDTFLTFDLENDYDQPAAPDVRRGNRIKTVQFSLYKDTAIRFVWNQQNIPVIRAILALQGLMKWSWNGWKHDAKILADFDCPVAGPHLDGFWLFHHVEPDLTTEDSDEGTGISSRLGLQYAASLYGWYRRWKQLGSDDPEYQCIDVDVLQYIIPEIIAQAKAEGLWDSYLKHVVDFYPILDDVTRRGIPVSEERRQSLRTELVADLVIAEQAIQDAYPRELLNIYPEQGFVRPPKWDGESYRNSGVAFGSNHLFNSEWYDKDDSVWRPMELRSFVLPKVQGKKECACVHETASCTTCCCGKPTKSGGQGAQKRGLAVFGGTRRPSPECNDCGGKGIQKVTLQNVTAERWCCVLPFKPSPDQIIKYMVLKGHKVPKKRGRGGGNTTERKEIEKLAVKHPGEEGALYTKIVAKRKLEKIISTYVDGWAPSEDGCVHGELLMATATGQLNAVKPNILNPPRPDTLLGMKFNSMIVAPPGRTFVDMDFKSFHGATLAALSGDEVYYKVAVKAGDAHSFLASYLVGKGIDSSLPLDALISALKEIKSQYESVRNKTAKPANLGWGFGLKGPGLYDRYEEYFTPKKCHYPSHRKPCGEACEVMDMLDRLYAQVTEFRRSQAAQAAQKSEERILSPSGHHRRFYSVYQWRQQKNAEGEPQWVRSDGPDMEDVFAFAAANTAHCHFREVMIDLNKSGVLEKYWMMLPFHDALKWCTLIEQVDELIRLVYPVMTRPIAFLKHPVLCPNGLVVDVDVKVGPSWDKMKSYDLKGVL